MPAADNDTLRTADSCGAQRHFGVYIAGAHLAAIFRGLAIPAIYSEFPTTIEPPVICISAPRMSHITQIRLAFVLASIVALGPLALDAYLPAFTDIALEFGSTTREVGLTLSLYVIALAIGQLVGGPLSDRLGRGRVMYCGLALFFIGSLLVAVSGSLAAMLGGRLVQAFGGGCSVVGVAAIVRERTEGNETARLFSLIAMIMFAVPALAPAVGALLLLIADWRIIFVFLALYAIYAALMVRLVLFPRGTLVRTRANEPLHRLITNYAEVLRQHTAVRFIALQALAFGVMMIYLTHAPFIYQEWLDFSNAGFTTLFAFNVVVMMGFSMTNRRLLLRHSGTAVLSVALYIQAGGVALLASIVLFGLPKLLAVPTLAVVVGSLGAISPNNMAGALQTFRALAGTAAALMGATQFAVGGLLGSVSAMLPLPAMTSLVLTMGVCSALALSLLAGVRRGARLQAGDAAQAGSE